MLVFQSRLISALAVSTRPIFTGTTVVPIKLLERLADARKNVKAQIDDEINTIKIQTPQSILNPAFSPATEMGKLFRPLNKDTKPKDKRLWLVDHSGGYLLAYHISFLNASRSLCLRIFPVGAVGISVAITIRAGSL